MASLRTVLFFTHAEYGQANVNIATSYELALAGVNICISSFASLEPRVSHLQELVARHHDATCSSGRSPGSVSFHECKGFPSYVEIIKKHGIDITTFPHPPGLLGALKCYSRVDSTFFPWDPHEHLAAIESIKELITTVKPDVVAIDIFFYFAVDACQLVGQKFVITLPNSIKDVAVNLQPRFEALWKYPVAMSGLPYPLRWWQIPLNIFLYVRLAIILITATKIRRIRALRRSLGIKRIFEMEFYPGVTHICPALPETDFPLTVIPEGMVLCGPILMPFDPLEERDSALKTWLDEGPTVVVNLGSHSVSNETLARETASAFRLVLAHHDKKGLNKLRVLWKARGRGDIQKVIDNIIGKEIKEGRIKVVPWLDAEPISVLQHPNVICTVHHGGANSFFEGVWSGIPHVVLPVWLDTYDYANRAEYLGIGVFGNKTSAPRVRAEELGEALVRVTGDTEESRAFRSAAQRLRTTCRAKGDGRKLAAAAILKEVGITT